MWFSVAMDIFVDLYALYILRLNCTSGKDMTNLLLCKQDYLLYITVANFNIFTDTCLILKNPHVSITDIHV